MGFDRPHLAMPPDPRGTSTGRFPTLDLACGRVRTIGRFHGGGWGRMVGDGGRMGCARQVYGSGAASERRHGLGLPRAPYAALPTRVGRVEFGDGF